MKSRQPKHLEINFKRKLKKLFVRNDSFDVCLEPNIRHCVTHVTARKTIVCLYFNPPFRRLDEVTLEILR